MNAIIASLSEVVKMITEAFRLSAIFPALFFLLLNRFFVFQHFENLPPFSQMADQGLWDQALIISLLAFLIGYTINAIEVSIVRLYEGYPWQDTFIGKVLTDWQRNRLLWLEARLERLRKDRDYYDELRHFSPSPELEKEVKRVNTRIARYQSEVDEFPPNEARVLPTELGNIIAAFEAYPRRRYGMDGVTFWPRMYHVLAKESFLPYVTQARSTMDFLLNTSFLMAVFGIECILLRIFFISEISWILPTGAFAAAWVFYLSAMSSARDWAVMFQAAFDLFRYHLADALGLKPKRSFEQEQKQWRDLTVFVQSASEFDGFNHSWRSWPVVGSKKEGKT